MGQYWVLINLDKRQSLGGHLGKIQEIIYNSPHAALIPYLVVPTTPVDPSVRHAERLGSWAGDRLIFIGDYNKKDCYPKGVLTAEETEEFKEEGLYHVAYDWEKAPTMRLPRDAVAFAHDKVWVVRNLSKRIYARSDAFGTAAKYMRGPEATKGRSLADIVLAVIHWSTHGDRGNFGWGRCAGDRFDICVGDVVDREEGWNDVSEVVAEQVREMWGECDVYDDD
ncbi:hypothetical protein H0H81_012573 [Sphagnurus paluster]|uniref:Uncharacterized protein n=1 Tax=Sphagnurus paluster TaxID=117069 RepID=A0A9P7KHZ7_9AGAR|nr:hypothetical protein H0H81_012573 [Sphagnurus paluster]